MGWESEDPQSRFRCWNQLHAVAQTNYLQPQTACERGMNCVCTGDSPRSFLTRANHCVQIEAKVYCVACRARSLLLRATYEQSTGRPAKLERTFLEPADRPPTCGSRGRRRGGVFRGRVEIPFLRRRPSQPVSTSRHL